jgi:hypothetical protein
MASPCEASAGALPSNARQCGAEPAAKSAQNKRKCRFTLACYRGIYDAALEKERMVGHDLGTARHDAHFGALAADTRKKVQSAFHVPEVECDRQDIGSDSPDPPGKAPVIPSIRAWRMGNDPPVSPFGRTPQRPAKADRRQWDVLPSGVNRVFRLRKLEEENSRFSVQGAMRDVPRTPLPRGAASIRLRPAERERRKTHHGLNQQNVPRNRLNYSV